MIYVEYYSTNRSLFYFKVWPVGKVVFPDFFKNSTKQIWKELIVKQHTETITFDGLWIVSNADCKATHTETITFDGLWIVSNTLRL